VSKTPVKTAGKAASTPAPATVAAVSAAAGAKSRARAPVARPASKTAPAAGAAPKSSAKKTASSTTSAAAPVPTHSFADRFGPARTAARTLPEPMNTAKPAVKADPKLANAWKTKPGRELSEAELLAMPESEYMNEQQIDFFRARLQAQKDDLLSNAGETTEHLREDTTIVPDPADRATIEEEHALELRTRDRERKLLKKISQALNLLETGEYGFCDETGEPIGLPRLLARPTATLSLEAQQRRELKQKMFGD
jgi:DnaK suppressor protein